MGVTARATGTNASTAASANTPTNRRRIVRRNLMNPVRRTSTQVKASCVFCHSEHQGGIYAQNDKPQARHASALQMRASPSDFCVRQLTSGAKAPFDAGLVARLKCVRES